MSLLAVWGVAVAVAGGAAGSGLPRHVRFDFGSGPVAPGVTRLSPTTPYSTLGYGFEPSEAPVTAHPGGYVTSDRPFFFSVALPEGNYRVTAAFGDPRGPSSTTVKAELRRLMVENVKTVPEETAERSFIVNLRTPALRTGQVRLKARERTTESWAWDEKLTLEFNGGAPKLRSLEIEAVDVPTVYLLGDSTVCDQPREPYASWGQMLTAFFSPAVAVANHAESGESYRSSRNASRLDKVLELLRPGDWVIMQFGHNDQKEEGEGAGAFGHYTDEIRRYVAGVRARGGSPVLVTSMHRLRWDEDGRIENSLGDFPEAVRRAAAELHVPLIDLHAMSARFYEALGPAVAPRAFKEGDLTHHDNYGAYELGRAVTVGIREEVPELAKQLLPELAAFDPGRPDPVDAFALPASPAAPAVTPEGS